MDMVFQKMTEIANKQVQHFKTDFTVYDRQTYGRMYDGTQFIWCVRPTGTYICGIPKTISYKSKDMNSLSMSEFIKEQERKVEFQKLLKDIADASEAIINGFEQNYFLVTKGKSIKEITKEMALKEVANA